MNINKNEKGFSYIDTMIGLVILMIGVLALAAAVTTSVVRSRESEQQLIAKQLANSALESIFSARDIRLSGAIGWNSIGNLGSNIVDGVAMGIFVPGQSPIRTEAGNDGIIGTADDACAGNGPCCVGGICNNSQVLTGFQRRITITDINDPQRPTPPWPIMMRQVEVIIYYHTSTAIRQERVSTVISSYQ
jgi:type II secretory pathway pseudopilin PulG